MELYTDSRSTKCDELRQQSLVELCWLLPKARHQYACAVPLHNSLTVSALSAGKTCLQKDALFGDGPLRGSLSIRQHRLQKRWMIPSRYPTTFWS